MIDDNILLFAASVCRLQVARFLKMLDDPGSKKSSSGQKSVKGPGRSAMKESSKPITLFLHEEDRIRELFKRLKIADCSRLSVSIEEEEESAELDAGKSDN